MTRTDLHQPYATEWQRDEAHGDWVERIYPDTTEWFHREGPPLIVVSRSVSFWSVLDYRPPPGDGEPKTVAGPFDDLNAAKVAYMLLAFS